MPNDKDHDGEWLLERAERSSELNDADVGKRIRFCNDFGTVMSSHATNNGLSCYLVKTDAGAEAYWPYSNFVEVLAELRYD